MCRTIEKVDNRDSSVAVPTIRPPFRTDISEIISIPIDSSDFQTESSCSPVNWIITSNSSEEPNSEINSLLILDISGWVLILV